MFINPEDGGLIQRNDLKREYEHDDPGEEWSIESLEPVSKDDKPLRLYQILTQLADGFSNGTCLLSVTEWLSKNEVHLGEMDGLCYHLHDAIEDYRDRLGLPAVPVDEDHSLG